MNNLACNIFQLIGLILLGAGLWLYYPPLCMIILGCIFIWVGYVHLDEKDKKRERIMGEYTY